MLITGELLFNPFTYSEEVIPLPFRRDCLTITTNPAEERGTSRSHRLGPTATGRLTLTLAVKTTHITILSSPKKDIGQLQAFH